LDRRQKQNQVSEQGHLNAAAGWSSAFQKLNIKGLQEAAANKDRTRQRRQDDDQRCAFRELPARAFELPRHSHDNSECYRQPHTGSAATNKASAAVAMVA